MCRIEDGIVRYAPLCIYTFRLIAPRKLLEAQLFNKQYQRYEEIQSIPERLKWHRYQNGLMQKEVADILGVTRRKYQQLELGTIDYYPKELLDKLSELYKIRVEDFLDDYNLFLYKGQGQMIRKYREQLGLERKEFAQLIDVNPGVLRSWENESNRINKESWENCFKNMSVKK